MGLLLGACALVDKRFAPLSNRVTPPFGKVLPSDQVGTTTHHFGILMFENVAVMHEGVLYGSRLGKLHQQFDLVFDRYRVFPAGVFSARRPAVFRQDQKAHAMNMEKARAHRGLNRPLSMLPNAMRCISNDCPLMLMDSIMHIMPPRIVCIQHASEKLISRLMLDMALLPST